MDSDEERSGCEEEMNKLRSSSASPSALSTASSASPLVRGSSASSGKRPAPTSIAAAQLQCQQQQQQQQQQQHLPDYSKRMRPGKLRNADRSSSTAVAIDEAKDKKRGVSASTAGKSVGKENEKSFEAKSKSLGYNLAKSMAFKAYSSSSTFKQQRALELTPTQVAERKQQQAATGPTAESLQRLDEQREANSGLGESIETLNSQPLTSASSSNPQVTSGSNKIATDDEISDNGKYRRKSTSAIFDGADNQASGKFFSEREIEESTSTTSKPNDNELPEVFIKQQGIGDAFQFHQKHPQPAGSLIEPILSHIFSDVGSEFGNIFKELVRNSKNGTNGKPIIRRSKNGATIIISSTFTNESSPLMSNETNNGSSSSQIPSLLEKLLPPIFFKSSTKQPPANFNNLESNSSTSANSQQPQLASASITIQSSADPFLVSAGSAPFARLGPLAPLLDPLFPSPIFGRNPSNRPPTSSFFMEPLGGGMGAMRGGPFMLPFMPPMSGGPSGLLGMMMRVSQAASQMPDQPEILEFTVPSAEKTSVGKLSVPESNGVKVVKDSLPSQQSPLINSSSSQENPTKVESPFEFRLRPHSYGRQSARGPHPSAHSGGSMLIFSSSGSSPMLLEGPQTGLDPFPSASAFGPFISGPPQMFLLNGPEQPGPSGWLPRASESVSGGSLNPILRTILNSVMTDLSGSSLTSSSAPSSTSSLTEQLENQKEGSKQFKRQRSASASSASPSWTSLAVDSLDSNNEDSWPTRSSESDRTGSSWMDANEQQAAVSRSMRARHRSSPIDSQDELSAEASQDTNEPHLFNVAGIQFESNAQQQPQLDHSHAPQILNNNRQSQQQIQQQQVPAGLKSQSLSRIDEDENGPSVRVEKFNSDRFASGSLLSHGSRSSLGSIFLKPIDEQTTQHPQNRHHQHHHMGIFGRILSDLSRRSEQAVARGFPTSKNRADILDLDEGDSSSDSAEVSSVRRLSSSPSWKERSHKPEKASSPFQLPQSHVQEMTFPMSDHLAQYSQPELHLVPESMFSLYGPHQKWPLEDTVNTMEDRLDMSFAQQQQQQQQQQQASEVAIKQLPQVQQSVSNQQQQQQQQPDQSGKQVSNQHENPFTSPSSQLFGFPASFLSQQQPQQLQSQSQSQPQIQLQQPLQESASLKKGLKAQGSQVKEGNRQQRSFTYHSNNEPATPFKDDPSIHRDTKIDNDFQAKNCGRWCKKQS